VGDKQKKKTVNQKMLSLREHHDRHKDDFRYRNTLNLYITEILKERVQFIQRISLLMTVTAFSVIVFSTTVLLQYPLAIGVFTGICIISLISLSFLLTSVYFERKKKKQKTSAIDIASLPELTSLTDSLIVALDPFRVVGLCVNEKEVTQLGGLMSCKLATSIKLKENTVWNEVGITVGLLATRLCLFKMFSR
jgi:hypothetical protein